MPEEWFDVAYINFDKAILHGRKHLGFTGYDRPTSKDIEQVLTEEQKELIIDMNERHRDEMQQLLRGFAYSE